MEKLVLNQHADVTNIVTNKDMRNEIDKTLDILIERLTSICGPFTRETLLFPYMPVGTPVTMANDSRVFLHDGIKIIKAIEFSSPIQQYIRNIVAYIGECVDDVAKDGTTSAMLFSCHFLKHMLNSANNSQSFPLIPSNHFMHWCKSIMNILLGELKKTAITKENIGDLIESSTELSQNEKASIIAFLQAYTSSGGDTEIAGAIKQFYAEMPSEYWSNSIYFETSRIEQDYRIKCEYLGYELQMRTYCVNDFTRLEVGSDGITHTDEDIDIYIARSPMADHSVDTVDLFNYLDHSTRPILILYPNYNTASVGSSITDKLLAYSNPLINKGNVKKVLICGYVLDTDAQSASLEAVNSLLAKHNCPPYGSEGDYDFEDYVIKGASIKLTTHFLEIKNVTPVDEEVVTTYALQQSRENDEAYLKLLRNLHPGELDPKKYIHYSTYLNHIRSRHAVMQKMRGKDEYIEKQIVMLEDTITKMRQRDLLILRIGGTTHDVTSIKAIVEDAAGAALSAVKNGVYTNMFWRLYKLSNHLANQMENDIRYTSGMKGIVVPMFCEAVRHACAKVVEATLSTTKDLCKAHDVVSSTVQAHLDEIDLTSPTSYIDVTKWISGSLQRRTDYKSYLERNKQIDMVEDFSEMDISIMPPINGMGIPPVQTIDSLNEIFSRFNDLLLKIIITDNLVISGTVWDNDK